MHLPLHRHTFALAADNRLEDRRALQLRAQVSTQEHASLAVQLLNLSPAGMLVMAEELHMQPGERLTLHHLDGRTSEAEAVWSSGGYTGLNFAAPLTDAQIAALLLRAEPMRTADDHAAEEPPAPRRRSAVTTLWPERSFAVPVVLAVLFWGLAIALAGVL